jgi:outer membrane protein assembly factor BamB
MGRRAAGLCLGFLPVVLTLCYSACSVGSLDAGKRQFDWPRWRGPQANNISLETGWNAKALAPEPKIVWKKDVGLGYSNIVIEDSRLFISGQKKGDFTVFCLDAATGRQKWRTSYESPAESYSTACIDGDCLYTLDRDGILLCLEKRNGNKKWQRDIRKQLGVEKLNYGYATSPVIAGNLLLLNLNRSGIALDKEAGEVIWDSGPSARLRNGYYATVVLYRNEEHLSGLFLNEECLTSVAVETGRTEWAFPWRPGGPKAESGNTNMSDPLVLGDSVFLSSFAGSQGCALLRLTGSGPKTLWANQHLCTSFANAVEVGDHLFGYDDAMGFCCLRVQDGKVAWRQSMRFAITLASNSKLIILEEDGTLRIAKAMPTSYSEISSCTVPSTFKPDLWWNSPVLCEGRIYCRSYLGELVCIDVRG